MIERGYSTLFAKQADGFTILRVRRSPLPLMFELIAKNYTISALDYDKGTFVKLEAFNKGRDVGIWLDGKVTYVPVQEFYEKMKAMFGGSPESE